MDAAGVLPARAGHDRDAVRRHPLLGQQPLHLPGDPGGLPERVGGRLHPDLPLLAGKHLHLLHRQRLLPFGGLLLEGEIDGDGHLALLGEGTEEPPPRAERGDPVDVEVRGPGQGARQLAGLHAGGHPAVHGTGVIPGFGQRLDKGGVGGGDPGVPAAGEPVAPEVVQRFLQLLRRHALRQELAEDGIQHVGPSGRAVPGRRGPDAEPAPVFGRQTRHQQPGREEADRLALEAEQLRKLGEERHGRTQPPGKAPGRGTPVQGVPLVPVGHPQPRREAVGTGRRPQLVQEALRTGGPQGLVGGRPDDSKRHPAGSRCGLEVGYLGGGRPESRWGGGAAQPVPPHRARPLHEHAGGRRP